MFIIYSVLISLVPILFFVALMLWWDRKEPEPKKLLAKLFLAGALCWVVVYLLLELTQIVFVSLNIAPPFDLIPKGDLLPVILSAVFIALLNELVKIAAAKRLAFAQKAFNQTVDGIVYMTTVAWGAALIDNFYQIHLLAQKGESLDATIILQSTFTFIFLPLIMGISSGFSGLALGKVHHELSQPIISFKNLMANKTMLGGLAIAVIIQAAFRTLVAIEETRFAGLVVLLSAVLLFSNFSARKFNQIKA